MAKFNIKKVTTRAKQIRAKHKSMSWQAAVKKAGKELRGKKTRTRKKAAPKKRRRITGIKTNRDAVDRKRVNVTIGSVSHHKSMAKKGIKDQIERAAGRRELAIKVNERKKLSRTIAKLKKDYRALC